MSIKKKWDEILSLRTSLEEVVAIMIGLKDQMESKADALEKLRKEKQQSESMFKSKGSPDTHGKRRDDKEIAHVAADLEELKSSYDEVRQLERHLRSNLETAVFQLEELERLMDTSKDPSTGGKSQPTDMLFSILNDQINSYKREINELKVLHNNEKSELIALHQKEKTEIETLLAGKDTHIVNLNQKLENATKSIEKTAREQSISEYTLESALAELTHLKEENKSLLEKLSNSMIQKVRFPDDSQITALFTVLNDQLEANKRELESLRASHRQEKADLATIHQKAIAEYQTIISTKDVELIFQAQKMDRLVQTKDMALEALSAEQQSLLETKTQDFKSENIQLKNEISALNKRLGAFQLFIDSQRDRRTGISLDTLDQYEQAKELVENQVTGHWSVKLEQVENDFRVRMAEMELDKIQTTKSLEKKVAELTKSVQEREKDIVAMKKEIKSLSLDKRRLEEDYAILSAKSSTNDTRVAELLGADDRRLAEQFRTQFEGLTEKFKLSQKKMDDLESQNQSFQRQLGSYKDAQSEWVLAQSKIEILKGEKDRLQRVVEAAELTINDLRKEIREIQLNNTSNNSNKYNDKDNNKDKNDNDGKTKQAVDVKSNQTALELQLLRERVVELEKLLASHELLFRTYEATAEQGDAQCQADLQDALKKVSILEERLQIQSALQLHLERELELAQEESASTARRSLQEL